MTFWQKKQLLTNRCTVKKNELLDFGEICQLKTNECNDNSRKIGRGGGKGKICEKRGKWKEASSFSHSCVKQKSAFHFCCCCFCCYCNFKKLIKRLKAIQPQISIKQCTIDIQTKRTKMSVNFAAQFIPCKMPILCNMMI